MSELRPGTVIAGKFRIERRIGAGAMAFVYEALHLDLRQKVALKFLNDSYRSDPDAASRFVREARAQFSLRSEHVGRVFDVGRTESGQPFIVMELLEGQSLKEILDDRERLAVPEALEILLQVCEGVGEAHALGIVHRDLKPGNIFVTKGGGGAPMVKVLDFGLAKARDHASEGSLTAADMLIGTPRYMAPEQFAHAGNAGASTDVWSLGIVLYRMVTGDLPFDGPHPLAIAQRIRSEEAVPPSRIQPDVPDEVSALVMRCLVREPSQRFANATALGQAVAALLPRVSALPTSTPLAGGGGRGSEPPTLNRSDAEELSLSGDDATEVAAHPPVSVGEGGVVITPPLSAGYARVRPGDVVPPGVIAAAAAAAAGASGAGTSETRIATQAPRAPVTPPHAFGNPSLPLPPPLEDEADPNHATRKRPALAQSHGAPIAHAPLPAAGMPPPGVADYRTSAPSLPPALGSAPQMGMGLPHPSPAPPGEATVHDFASLVTDIRTKVVAAGPVGWVAMSLAVIAAGLLVFAILYEPPKQGPVRVVQPAPTQAAPPPVVTSRVFTTLDEQPGPAVVDAGAHRSLGR